MSHIYKAQGLVIISLDTGKDISTATVMKILYRQPDGTKGSWVATLKAGSNSVIQYTTANADLSLTGSWKLQAFVTVGGINEYGDIVELVVERSLDV